MGFYILEKNVYFKKSSPGEKNDAVFKTRRFDFKNSPVFMAIFNGLSKAKYKPKTNILTHKHIVKNKTLQVYANLYCTLYSFSIIKLCSFCRTTSYCKSTMCLSSKYQALLMKCYYQCDSNEKHALKQCQTVTGI